MLVDGLSPCHEHLTSLGPCVRYRDEIRQYSILIEDYGDGVTKSQAISYCPICGAKLPSSLRDTWFDRLEERGVDPMNDPIPEEFSDGRWWRSEDAERGRKA